MRAPSVAASALVLVLVGCHDERGSAKATPDAAPPPPSATAPVASTPAPPPTPPSSAAAKKPPACRIVSGEGEGAPPPTADASAWLELGPKARFSVRVTETGKELRFEGPGRVRPCGGDVALVALVAEGTVIGLPGGGEAAGNEQWAATPCAVARWAAGVHRLTTEKDGCILQASVGTSWLWVPEGARVEDAPLDGGAPDAGLPESVDGWRRVDARRAVRIRTGAPAPVPAVLACEKAASDVDAIAAKMAHGEDGGAAKLGELMPTSIAARKYARAACALAAARTYAAKADAGLEARVAKALARL